MSLRFVSLAWAGIALITASSLAADQLVLLPAKPKVGEPFQVAVMPLPAGQPAEGQYVWQVTVADEAGNDITAGAAPATLPNAAALDMPAVVAGASYSFTLKISAPTASELALTAEAGASVMIVTSSQPAEAEPPATPMPAAAEAAPTPVPTPAIGDLEKMSAKLNAARDWARRVADLPKFESLVLPVEFFQTGLARRPDGTEGILEFDQRPILHAAMLHQAMYSTANRFPAESDPELFIEAWARERETFIASLVATERTKTLWREFLAAWEAEVGRENPARFREALIQAPLIVAGLLLEFDDRHIADAMTGGGPAERMGPGYGAAGYGGTSMYVPGGYSHAAVHHARVMSRIHYRHARRMARFGY